MNTNTAENEKHVFFGECTRKPIEWAEIPEAHSAYHELQKTLPVFTPQQAFSWKQNPLEKLKEGVPQWFILRREDADYLINTEGYSYARYALKLKPETGHTEPESECGLCNGDQK